MAGMSISGVLNVTEMFDGAVEMYTDSSVFVVGTNVEYSVYVEFGTSKMEAQPYLRPAIEAAVRDADRLFETSGDIEEFKRKLALTIEAEAKNRVPVKTTNLKGSIEAERVR